MSSFNRPDKIHILGGPGSGKSYLADKLSEKLDLPHIDLDTLCWDEDFGARIPVEERNADLRRIAGSDRWIIEGAYCSEWLTPSFEAADTILRLDVRRSLQMIRLTRRLGARVLHGETDMVRARNLLSWVDGFEEVIERFPSEYAQKVIPILGKKSLAAYVDSITN